MSFKYQGKRKVLRGTSQLHPDHLKPNKVDKLLQQGSQAYNIQVGRAGSIVMQCRSISTLQAPQAADMMTILDQYNPLFQEPTLLPPKRPSIIRYHCNQR